MRQLRRQKCKQNRKTIRQKKGRCKRKNCLWKCFHSFKYRSWECLLYFLHKQFTLLCVISSVVFAASLQLRLLRNSDKIIVIQIFYLDIWIFLKSSMKKSVNLSNFENVLQKTVRRNRTWQQHLEAQILKNFPAHSNNGFSS